MQEEHGTSFSGPRRHRLEQEPVGGDLPVVHAGGRYQCRDSLPCGAYPTRQRARAEVSIIERQSESRARIWSVLRRKVSAATAATMLLCWW